MNITGWVYYLLCNKTNNILYIGASQTPSQRMYQHKNNFPEYDFRLETIVRCANIKEAMGIEAMLIRHFSERLPLLNKNLYMSKGNKDVATFYLNPELKHKFKYACTKSKLSMSEVITRFMEAYLKDQKIIDKK